MSLRHRQGFSLIELMVTITVLSILILLAIPNYRDWILNTHVRNAAESVQNGLRLARNEAVQRGTNVRFQLTSSSNGADWTICIVPVATPQASDCAGSTAFVQSFVAAAGATDVQVGTTTSIATAATYTTALSGGVPAGITFNALGRPVDFALSTGAASVVRIDAKGTPAGSRRLVTTVSAGGQVRMCDPQLSLSVSPQGCS